MLHIRWPNMSLTEGKALVRGVKLNIEQGCHHLTLSLVMVLFSLCITTAAVTTACTEHAHERGDPPVTCTWGVPAMGKVNLQLKSAHKILGSTTHHLNQIPETHPPGLHPSQEHPPSQPLSSHHFSSLALLPLAQLRCSGCLQAKRVSSLG